MKNFDFETKIIAGLCGLKIYYSPPLYCKVPTDSRKLLDKDDTPQAYIWRVYI
jgi:hypothetical protein